MNRYKVTKQTPLTDLYTSSSWRYNPACIVKLADNEEELFLLQRLLDSDLDCYGNSKHQAAFVRDLLNQMMSKTEESDTVFLNSHTIGDQTAVVFRAELLRAFRKDKVPITAPSIHLSLEIHS